jgi:hypothetical protein
MAFLVDRATLKIISEYFYFPWHSFIALITLKSLLSTLIQDWKNSLSNGGLDYTPAQYITMKKVSYN